MTEELLLTLAAGGLEAVPIEQFGFLEMWCRDWCVATGDGRFCIVSELLREIDAATYDQGLALSVAEQVDRAIRSELPHILSAETPASGAQQAQALLEELRRVLGTEATSVKRNAGCGEGVPK